MSRSSLGTTNAGTFVRQKAQLLLNQHQPQPFNQEVQGLDPQQQPEIKQDAR